MTTFETVVVALLIYIAISIDWKNDEGFLDYVFKGFLTGLILGGIIYGLA